MTDWLADTPNPAALDQVLQQIGGALVQLRPGEYEQRDGHYLIRCLGDPGFIRFACEHQGYCRIVGEA